MYSYFMGKFAVSQSGSLPWLFLWGGGGGVSFYLTFLPDFYHCWWEQTFLKIWNLYPTQYFNILVLLNNEDKYCYLQFNVTREIEKILEIWSLQIVRKGIWPCPPAMTRLNVFSSSIVNSNSDSEHFYALRITWIYLKIYWKSTWNCSWAIIGAGGIAPPPPGRYGPGHSGSSTSLLPLWLGLDSCTICSCLIIIQFQSYVKRVFASKLGRFSPFS